MLPMKGHRLLLCAAALLTAAGCQMYRPYSPYQYQPGYYMPPAGTVPAQGATYLPPGSTYQPTPVTNPQLGPSSPFPEAANDQWRQADGQSSGANGNPNTFYEDFSSEKPVPDYRTNERPIRNPASGSNAATNDFGAATDPNAVGGTGTNNFGARRQPGNRTTVPAATDSGRRELEADSSANEFDPIRNRSNDRRSFESGDDTFDADPPAGGSNPGAAADPLNPFSAVEPAGGPILQVAANVPAEEFQPPIVGDLESPQTLNPDPNAGPVPPSPFAYDADQYKWLRGVVSFDERRRNWQIMYSRAPNETDDFGGTATLVTDERFEQLNANDVILVEGEFDAHQRDELGKPKYRVDHLARLVPQAN